MLKKPAILLSIIAILTFSACNNSDEPQPVVNPYDKGSMFIVNEGNYTSANSSLSYYLPDSSKVVNSIFYRANDLPLGDVAQSMMIYSDKAFLTINNSGHIYVTDVNTSVAVGKISGLISPRELLFVDNTKVYITDLSSKSITIANPETYEVTGSIAIGKSTEAIISANNKVFVSNWSSYYQKGTNNTIMVIDPSLDEVIDSVIVGIEPVSLVIDKNNDMWVLCSGGYMNEENPSLWRINTTDLSVEKTYTFENVMASPDNLCINNDGDMLYYLNKGVYIMSIDDNTLPSTPLITQDNKNFYALGIDPQDTNIYVSDALDYSHNGIVYRYTSSGTLIEAFETGIIPGDFCFY